MSEETTTSTTTTTPATPVLRERIGRKAKDRAVETLHELTTNTSRATPSKSNESITSGGGGGGKSNNKSALASNKKNNRSYRPFAEQTIPSDDEQQDGEESPRKTRVGGGGGRNKNTTSRLSTRTTKNGSRLGTVPAATTAVMTEEQLADTTTNSLFTQLYQGQVATQTLVDDFVDLYKKDKDTAMLDLIKLIVRCSGCKSGHLLTRELIRTKEFTEAINDLIDNFSNEDEEAATAAAAPTEIYLLVQNTAQAKRFNRNFCEFLTLLVGQCQHSIIYDQFMLDVLISFLIALADSQVRAFRHTATLAVLKVMTSLVDILLSLSVSKDACQRQYDNERQKTSAKRASDRIEMLLAKRKEIEENELEIQNFINFIFKAVFIHRYRDVCAEIRCICMNEIGEWMAKCPDKFLDDTFLKYIGWTLYDKAGECRLKCLQALQPLYDSEELHQRLELFTSRFKNRLVEMSLDKEIEVAVSAIKLLTCVVMQNDSALEDRDCENLYELVFHTNRSMAQAAGEFLNQKLFNKMDTTVNTTKRGGGSKKAVNQNASMLQLLVQFLIECELHDHPTYLVDAMWDLHPMLKDWKCMTDLLLDESNTNTATDSMNDMTERYLIETITCCVRQAATGEIPVARRPHTTQRKLNAKELKQIQDDRVALTQHFMTVLPQLLTKFIADPEKLANLLEIPLNFDLAQYTLRRQEKSLDSLLKLVEEIVFKHHENEVLETAAWLLAYMCDQENSNTIHTRCDVIRSAILDKLVDQYQKAMETVEKMEEVDDSEMYPLIAALRRLSAFARYHDISQYDLLKTTLIILRWVDDNEGFSADFISRAISLARHLIYWKKYKIWCEVHEAKETNQACVLNKEELEYVSKVSKKFVKHCTKLLVNDNGHVEEEAFFELCDMYTLFDHRDIQDELIGLHLEPTNNDVLMLNMFTSDHVFTQEALTETPDTAENIERLHKRRTILAAYAKLIINGIVQVKYAAEVFRGYAKYAASYGDIIKQLLSACREISKGATAKSMVLAMQQEFLHGFVEKGGANAPGEYRNSAEYTAMKELVHKFTLSFGPEASTKSRDAIVTIHHDSIEFVDQVAANEVNKQSRAPPNLMFLELISEFSSRLTAHDKKQILAELDRRFAKRANKIEGNNWQAYYSYRLSLMEQDHQQQAKTTTTKDTTATNNITTSNDTTTSRHQQVTASAKTRRQSNENDTTANLTNGSVKSRNNASRVSTAGRGNNRKTLTNQVIAEEVEEEAVAVEEENFEDEEVENIHKNGVSNNSSNDQHSEITINGIDSINNYTSINNKPTVRQQQTKKLSNGVDRVQEEVLLAKSSPNKRSRSPLVTSNNNNNSTINDESMSDGTSAGAGAAARVLTSTRIEPPTGRVTKSLGRMTRSSIGVIAGQRGVNFSEIESSNVSLGGGNMDESDDMTLAESSPAKRKRRSNDDHNENKAISNRRY